MRNRIILATGFEPFGEQVINASWEAVKLLPEEIGGMRVIKCRLPVAFGRAAKLALEEIRKTQPSFVFLVGEAGGRDIITPETTAKNRRVDIADNDGYEPQEGEKILTDGPDEIRTKIDVENILEKMKGMPIRLSADAGSYVCNDLFYLVLNSMQDTGIPVDFVHVPYTEGQQTRKKRGADGRQTDSETQRESGAPGSSEVLRTSELPEVPVIPSEQTAAVLERFIELAAEEYG